MESGQDASNQILAVFQNMAPLLTHMKDTDLKLPDNPALPKRPRHAEGGKGKGKHVKQEDVAQDDDRMVQAFKLMAKILIRQDQDIQSIKKEDSFVFFFNSKASTGALPLLLKSAATWHEQMKQENHQTPWLPLRQHLFKALLNDLVQRLHHLGKADPQSELVQTAIKQNILLKDLTCPFLEWNPHLQQLQVSRKQPLTLQKMTANLEEMLEICTEASLIRGFHAIPVSKTTETVPWKLQLSLRADREYTLMLSLCHAGVWMLQGASLKPHTQHQSGLATQLAQLIDFPQKKGTGKTKHQSKRT